jgi:hypothetical protein
MALRNKSESQREIYGGPSSLLLLRELIPRQSPAAFCEAKPKLRLAKSRSTDTHRPKTLSLLCADVFCASLHRPRRYLISGDGAAWR